MIQHCWWVAARGAITMPSSILLAGGSEGAITMPSTILVFSILLTEKLTVEKLAYVTVTGWYHRTFQYSVPFQLYFSKQALPNTVA